MKKILSMVVSLLIVAAVAAIVLVGLVAGIYAIINGIGTMLGVTANSTAYYIISVCITAYLMSNGADRVPTRSRI